MVVLIGIVIVTALIFMMAAASNRSDDRKLRAAPPGSTRVESKKAVWVNQTVERYARAGWSVVDQTTAKSLGSQARVTITFRKP